MANIPASTSMIVFDQEIDRLTTLCTHIAQMASNIRLGHLPNISYSTKDIESCYETLLCMAEGIEGSAILLESLFAIPQSYSISLHQTKSTRHHYTRDQLLQLRKHVTSAISDNTENLLKQVVERECNDAVDLERQSWRDIRTILMSSSQTKYFPH